MPRTHLFVSTVLACAGVVLVTAPATAQEAVRWRHDYAAARREAAETGRPLLLDFGTEACVWCRKLDATTFRDPRVAKLLNERFVPVKIDGNKDQRLTAALGIEAYPSLVLATADGKVVGRHEGYADVAQLATLLNKVPAPAAPAVRPVAANPGEVDPDRTRRAKEQLDADLTALHHEIAATLGR